MTMSCNNIVNFPVDGIRRLKLSMAVYLDTIQTFQSDEMVIQVSTRFGGEFGSIMNQAKECPVTTEVIISQILFNFEYFIWISEQYRH